MTQAWPKGKMIEGRSGGSGRGTRRELWAPPDSGSSTSGSYVVSCTDARPSPPTHFLPSAASSPSHLPAGHGEKFRRTRAHVQRSEERRVGTGPKAKWSKGGAGEMGGVLEENCGPHLTAVLLNQRIVRCIVYRRSTLAAPAFPSLRRFRTLAPACWPRGKILSHPSARSALHWSPQAGGPKGKMIDGRSGRPGRGTRRELWAPPDRGSAQPTDRRFVSCTDSRPEPFPAPPSHFLPSAASSPSHLPAGHREKFCRTQAHVQLGTRLRRMAGPKGK